MKKVAYVFALPRSASYKLAKMILPQLEAGTHGVEVAGMFFFDDNKPTGRRKRLRCSPPSAIARAESRSPPSRPARPARPPRLWRHSR